MVLLSAGYYMTFPDAKAWALRNWPDIDIWNDEHLALIITRYHRLLGSEFTCLPLEVEGEMVVFFVLAEMRDPLSTPFKHRTIKENEGALKFKAWLFNHEGDEELAEKTKFTTIADPFYDWRNAYSARQAQRIAQAEVEQKQRLDSDELVAITG